MNNQECNKNKNIHKIYSEFMLKIAKFEELVTQGSKLILDFQQALDFARRPPFEKTTAFVDHIVKSNETERLISYLEAGGLLVHDATKNISMLHLCHIGLMDHLIKGKCIVDELEVFVRNATTEDLYSADKISSKEMLIYEQKYDDADYVVAMAYLFSLVKQDYIMQEQIVSSLSLECSSGELESYSLMWSLRPFIDEDFMLSAWKLVP